MSSIEPYTRCPHIEVTYPPNTLNPKYKERLSSIARTEEKTPPGKAYRLLQFVTIDLVRTDDRNFGARLAQGLGGALFFGTTLGLAAAFGFRWTRWTKNRHFDFRMVDFQKGFTSFASGVYMYGVTTAISGKMREKNDFVNHAIGAYIGSQFILQGYGFVPIISGIGFSAALLASILKWDFTEVDEEWRKKILSV